MGLGFLNMLPSNYLKNFIICQSAHRGYRLPLSMIFFMVMVLLNTTFQANSNPLPENLDQIIEQALSEYHTPGMAVGITYKNEVILSKGYGIANLSTNKKVTSNTYFRLASTSKAFTAAAIGILVEQDKLNWNDKVIKYLPQFELYNPYVTHEFTILDLLTHRSGLPSGAGDSMIWPEPSGFSRSEVIQNLKFLTPSGEFRSSYAYSNVLYITAGEIIAKVSGIPFEKFVEENIFEPLDMKCYAGNMPRKAVKQSAMGYAHNDTRGIYPVTRNNISNVGLMSSAAGGMVCNTKDMLKWSQFLLKTSSSFINKNTFPKEQEPVSIADNESSEQPIPFGSDTLENMWSSHTILGVSDLDESWNNTLFRSYGLGWRLANFGELKAVSHTGTLSGYQAYIVLIPKLELGVVILNNGSHSAARGSVMQTIVKTILNKAGYLSENLTNVNWIDEYNKYLEEREQRYLINLSIPEATVEMSISDNQVIGTYEDQWFGQLIVAKNDDGMLRIHSKRMVTLKGTLIPFQDTSYKIEWDNKNAAGDAFMHFQMNVQRQITQATLHPFTNKNLSRHAYRDMLFKRID